MATTVAGTKNSAKRNLLGNAGIRYVGLVTAFVGLVILLLGRNITSTILQIASIVFVLVGLLLFVGNLKKLCTDKKEKDVVLFLLIGVLCLAIGILLYFYGSTIAKWIDIIIGSILAIYGLACLIYYLIHKKSNKVLFIFDIILFSLLLIAGVMVALMFKFGGSTYLTIVGIIATTTGVFNVIMH